MLSNANTHFFPIPITLLLTIHSILNNAITISMSFFLLFFFACWLVIVAHSSTQWKVQSIRWCVFKITEHENSSLLPLSLLYQRYFVYKRRRRANTSQKYVFRLWIFIVSARLVNFNLLLINIERKQHDVVAKHEIMLLMRIYSAVKF